jgi:group I intron endonuclease
MKYCVYCHTNKLNNKKYIGITSQIPENRWRNGKGYINNEYFYRAIEKYGWHNFSHEILYTGLSKEEAENLEIKLIAEYKTTNNEFGYNIEAGGNSTEKFTDNIRKKISQSLKGHVCSDETKKKISEAQKGKISSKKGIKATPEQIEKNRLSHLGQKAWNKGKVWGEKEKAKFGGKAIKCVETGVIYQTMHIASKETGVNISSICACCKKKKKTAGGYTWEYVPTGGV